MKLKLIATLLSMVFLAAGLRAAEEPDGRPVFGFKDPWHGPNFFMAPNPVRDDGVITYHLSSDGEASMEMFSLTGSLVYAWQLRGTPNSESQFQVQLGDVAPGIYVLVLTETVNGRAAVTGRFKVIVRH